MSKLIKPIFMAITLISCLANAAGHDERTALLEKLNTFINSSSVYNLELLNNYHADNFEAGADFLKYTDLSNKINEAGAQILDELPDSFDSSSYYTFPNNKEFYGHVVRFFSLFRPNLPGHEKNNMFLNPDEKLRLLCTLFWSMSDQADEINHNIQDIKEVYNLEIEKVDINEVIKDGLYDPKTTLKTIGQVSLYGANKAWACKSFRYPCLAVSIYIVGGFSIIFAGLS